MTFVLSRAKDRWLGRGEYAVTVPIFDGPLKPNQLLQNAEVVSTDFRACEDLTSDGERLYAAIGSNIVRVDPDSSLHAVETCHGRITALAVVDGGFAAALEGREIRIYGGRFAGHHYTEAGGRPFVSINAIAAARDNLFFSEGSRKRPVDEWRHDLMELGNSGRICAIDLCTRESSIRADKLGHAFGVLPSNGELWASESWRHRLISIDDARKTRAVAANLPGYPSRLVAAAGGGAWVTVFACRTQLVEFVLRERRYRQRMIETIAPDLWICPQLRAELSMHEPMQYARLKQLGQVKPWAPPRAYGLIVRLDSAGTPIFSLHSRVDGNHHGITACAVLNNQLYVLTKGAGRLLRLDIDVVESEFST